jgi:hypothetical protein
LPQACGASRARRYWRGRPRAELARAHGLFTAVAQLRETVPLRLAHNVDEPDEVVDVALDGDAGDSGMVDGSHVRGH